MSNTPGPNDQIVSTINKRIDDIKSRNPDHDASYDNNVMAMLHNHACDELYKEFKVEGLMTSAKFVLAQKVSEQNITFASGDHDPLKFDKGDRRYSILNTEITGKIPEQTAETVGITTTPTRETNQTECYPDCDDPNCPYTH